ncbi:tumor necrosis factor ligand superfamily member 13 isoform X1 [Clupea harengus]|uniref:Tumor necrosis factor ligand superfamily member 13 isoform X1 n=2 Tax=Clupea harengus TaxID=7950 RepID=A0A6P8FJ44_CLUHA|nr:tumor necrosis factor ligand superfamily member 13 isoform X1 [Clupea harengus]
MVQRVGGSTVVLLCAVSVLTTVCICFSVLLLHSEQIKKLRTDVMALKTKDEKANISGHATCCRGVWGCYTDAKGQSASRSRREVSKQGRQLRQTRRRRTFIHLQALSSHSHDKDDSTVIKWMSAWSQGEGLQVSEENVTVMTEGHYFIYSQVLYNSTIWIMGHVITKSLNGTGTKLMKCVKNMPNDMALNSCYTAGIFFLESGSVLELSVPRKSADLILKPYSTFFGLFSL